MKYVVLFVYCFLMFDCHQTRIFNDSTIVYQTKSNNQLAESDYYLLLPAGYHIVYFRGKDYQEYNFFPYNEKSKDSCSARFMEGCCVGDYGQFFLNVVMKDTIQSKLLDTIAKWTIYNCDTVLFAETFLRFNGLKAISAWIRSKRKTEADSFINVFATLKIKNIQ